MRGFSASFSRVDSISRNAGEEPLQVGQRHGRVGAARQHEVELRDDLRDQRQRARAGAASQIGQLTRSPFRIAHAEPGQPALDFPGIGVIGQEPFGSDPGWFACECRVQGSCPIV